MPPYFPRDIARRLALTTLVGGFAVPRWAAAHEPGRVSDRPQYAKFSVSPQASNDGWAVELGSGDPWLRGCHGSPTAFVTREGRTLPAVVDIRHGAETLLVWILPQGSFGVERGAELVAHVRCGSNELTAVFAAGDPAVSDDAPPDWEGESWRFSAQGWPANPSATPELKLERVVPPAREPMAPSGRVMTAAQAMMGRWVVEVEATTSLEDGQRVVARSWDLFDARGASFSAPAPGVIDLVVTPYDLAGNPGSPRTFQVDVSRKANWGAEAWVDVRGRWGIAEE